VGIGVVDTRWMDNDRLIDSRIWVLPAAAIAPIITLFATVLKERVDHRLRELAAGQPRTPRLDLPAHVPAGPLAQQVQHRDHPRQRTARGLVHLFVSRIGCDLLGEVPPPVVQRLLHLDGDVVDHIRHFTRRAVLERDVAELLPPRLLALVLGHPEAEPACASHVHQHAVGGAVDPVDASAAECRS
jgi:hypothetical protein